MPSNVKLLAGASGGEPTDANFKNVTLLLHGDGSNGAQNNTFIDSSTNNFTITRNGNTTQGSFSPYGSNWSNYFDGSGDYLTAPDNAALQLGSSNFTIEFWVNFSVVPGASQGATLVSKFDTSNTGYEVILFNNTLYFQAQSASIGLTYAWTPTAGRWYHIAWTRSGSNSYGFIDGALVASTSGASGSITNLAQALQLGRRGDNTLYLNGYLSNVRILKGTALYTAAFTPPTAPLTAITNTSLLTCADNRFRDGSTNNFTITRNGDVKVTNFSPFAPSSAYSTTTNGGSIFVDGTGDYLTLASNANLAPESSAFTWECWFYPNSFVGNTGDGDTLWITSASGGLQIGCDANTANWGVARSGIAWVLQTSTFPTNGMWNHIAIVRSGTGTNQAAIFLNGTRIAQGTLSSSFSAGSTNVLSVNGGAGNSIDGYVSSMRFVKGTAIYDPTNSTYTVPTTPLSAVTNTQLLLNATNAAIFDNSMKNDLETVGNAQISTSVKKFGTGSMAFDGNGDYLTTPNSPAFAFGTGSFTVECWLYITSNPSGSSPNSYYVLMDGIPVGGSGSRSTAFVWLIESTGKLNIFSSGSFRGASTSTVPLNQWVHLAIVRNGSSTVTYYINGQSSGTATVAADLTTGGCLISRLGDSSDGYLNGYLDDFRITKGVARYTANFTAPTAPFPNK